MDKEALLEKIQQLQLEEISAQCEFKKVNSKYHKCRKNLYRIRDAIKDLKDRYFTIE